MSRHEQKLQRLERKYLIDEPTAERIRRDIALYCEPDAHNPQCTGLRDRPGQHGYPIYSLYLDSPNLAFFQANMRGDPERLKLRVRTYSPTSPVLLELKRRVSDVIDKTRILVNREDVAAAVAGLASSAEATPEAELDLLRFARIATLSGAGPTLRVSYEREAHVSTVDHYARVCFDRHIAAERVEAWDLDPDPVRACRFEHFWRADLTSSGVVLELKCESAIPHWMTDLVHDHGLSRTSFSKYAVGIHVTERAAGRRRRTLRDARVIA